MAVKPAAPVHFGPPPPLHSTIRWKFDTGMLNPIWTPPPYPGSMYNCSNHIVLLLLLHVTPLYSIYKSAIYKIGRFLPTPLFKRQWRPAVQRRGPDSQCGGPPRWKRLARTLIRNINLFSLFISFLGVLSALHLMTMWMSLPFLFSLQRLLFLSSSGIFPFCLCLPVLITRLWSTCV